MTVAHRIAAHLGDVVNAIESLLNRLAVQVIADLDGNAVLVGPRGEFQGFRQVRQVLLAKPFQIGDVGPSLLDERRHGLHRRLRRHGNSARRQTLARFSLALVVLPQLLRNFDAIHPQEWILVISLCVVGILRMRGIGNRVLDPAIVPLELAVEAPLLGYVNGGGTHSLMVCIR